MDYIYMEYNPYIYIYDYSSSEPKGLKLAQVVWMTNCKCVATKFLVFLLNWLDVSEDQRVQVDERRRGHLK